MRKKCGFTLVELLLAMALFAMLATLVLRTFVLAQGTSSAVSAAALLEAQLSAAERTLQATMQRHPFAGFLYGDGQSVAVLGKIGEAHPLQSATFQEDKVLTFSGEYPKSPIAAGLIFHNGEDVRLSGVAEKPGSVELTCPPGIPWSPSVVYSAASTTELGIGAALNGRYGTSTFEDNTLYLRTDQNAWQPLLKDVASFSIGYVYRDPSGQTMHVYPDEGSEPWAATSMTKTDLKPLFPLPAITVGGVKLYASELVVRVALKANDVERRAEITVPLVRTRRIGKVIACGSAQKAQGSLILDIRGLPPGAAVTPVHVDGPDPDVVGDYGAYKSWPQIDAGLYTITANAVEFTDADGVLHRYAARIDPGVPGRLGNPVSWTVGVTSWRTTHIRVQYEEQPGVVTLAKQVIFVAVPLGWVVPGNGDGGVMGKSGKLILWYSGQTSDAITSSAPEFRGTACADGYPCTQEIGYNTGAPYPVWGGQASFYVAPGQYRQASNSWLSISWLLKVSVYPTFPIPTVLVGGCIPAERLAAPSFRVSSGSSTRVEYHYVCQPLIF